MSETGNGMRCVSTHAKRSASKLAGLGRMAEGEMKMRCRTVDDIAREALRIIDAEKSSSNEPRAEFFFRGESRNHKSDYNDEPIGTAFQSYLDRLGLVEYERELYQEAMRLNVASFEEDRTMVERVARMQHYSLPTRFADMSTNVLLSAHFACGGGELGADKSDDHRDGFIRIMKAKHDQIKSFTSDIIIAISHLPLVSAGNVQPSVENGLGYLTYEIKNNRPGFISEKDDKEIGKWLRDEIQHVWAFKPMMNSRRIRKQGGLFLAFGCGDNKKSLEPTFTPEDYDNPSAPSYGIKQIGYVQIAAEAKKQIREQLRFFGMESELVYPELSNVCDELKVRFSEIKKEYNQ